MGGACKWWRATDPAHVQLGHKFRLAQILCYCCVDDPRCCAISAKNRFNSLSVRWCVFWVIFMLFFRRVLLPSKRCVLQPAGRFMQQRRALNPSSPATIISRNHVVHLGGLRVLLDGYNELLDGRQTGFAASIRSRHGSVSAPKSCTTRRPTRDCLPSLEYTTLHLSSATARVRTALCAPRSSRTSTAYRDPVWTFGTAISWPLQYVTGSIVSADSFRDYHRCSRSVRGVSRTRDSAGWVH